MPDAERSSTPNWMIGAVGTPGEPDGGHQHGEQDGGDPTPA